MSQYTNNPILEGHVGREELAKIFGVTVRTIARWYKEKDGLPHILLGGRIIFNIESVKRWLAKREHSISPPSPKRRARVVE